VFASGAWILAGCAGMHSESTHSVSGYGALYAVPCCAGVRTAHEDMLEYARACSPSGLQLRRKSCSVCVKRNHFLCGLVLGCSLTSDLVTLIPLKKVLRQGKRFNYSMINLPFLQVRRHPGNQPHHCAWWSQKKRRHQKCAGCVGMGI
jgi:hypothetical protein